MLKRFVHLGACGLGLVLLVSGGQEVLSEVLPKAIAQEKEQEQTQAIEHEMPLEDPALEQQAQKLFRDLRCLVCEAEALASSPAPFAVSSAKPCGKNWPKEPMKTNSSVAAQVLW